MPFEYKVVIIIAWGWVLGAWCAHLYSTYFFGMPLSEIVKEIFGKEK